MNKLNSNSIKITSLLTISVLLASCNGGGSSSGSGSTPTTVGNFTQLTPNGGVQAPANPQVLGC